MSEPIGLAEFIGQVKRELLEPAGGGDTPLLLVDEVVLEIQVTASKEGRAGISVHVVDVGGTAKRGDAHTVRITLTPVLSHEQRTAALRESSDWDAIVVSQRTGTVKGDGRSQRDA